MRKVIERIELRTSSLSSGGWDVGSEELRFRGYASSLKRQDGICAVIRESTGLESVIVEPQGGTNFSGGSHFVSSRAQDREVVLTIEPHNKTQNELKHVLNRFISLSRDRPLTFAVRTRNVGEEETETFAAEAFITNVTAPIFSIETQVQVTFRMGSPTFVAEEQTVNEAAEFGEGSGGSWYGEMVLTEGEVDSFSAPGIFNILVGIRAGVDLQRLSIVDVEGDSVTYTPNEATRNLIRDEMPEWEGDNFALFQLNGEERRFYLSYGTRESQSESSQIPYQVGNRWPTVRPVNKPLRIEVRTGGSESPYSLGNTIMSYAKAVYGF